MDGSNVTGSVTLHDPMCPYGKPCTGLLCVGYGSLPHAHNYCNCDLIARVREDMRDCDAHGDTIRYRCTHYQQGRKDGYAAALRDAVAAIYRTCAHTKYEGCPPCPHDDAVAVIEALGGEG